MGARIATDERMKRELAAKERRRLAEAFPALKLDASQVPARVVGTMWLDSGVGFSIDLEVPGNYPHGMPELWCDPREIPHHADRHVYEDGRACLCVPSEYRTHWPPGSDLADFLESLVYPYLVGQAYYQDHGRWPPEHERSHGPDGIIEAYRERLRSLGEVSLGVILGFMELLARPSCPKGHETCPCGSGRRLRNCHRAFLKELRGRVDPDHAGTELEIMGHAGAGTMGRAPSRSSRRARSPNPRRPRHAAPPPVGDLRLFRGHRRLEAAARAMAPVEANVYTPEPERRHAAGAAAPCKGPRRITDSKDTMGKEGYHDC